MSQSPEIKRLLCHTPSSSFQYQRGAAITAESKSFFQLNEYV